MKRVRENHGCGEEYNVEKRKRGSIIIFPIISRLLGRILSGEEGKGTEIPGKRIKMGIGNNKNVVGNLIRPRLNHLDLGSWVVGTLYIFHFCGKNMKYWLAREKNMNMKTANIREKRWKDREIFTVFGEKYNF